MPDVFSFLKNSAAKYPYKVCVKHDERELTFLELYQKAARISERLRDSGVKPGDRVQIYLENSAEYIMALFAVFCAKGIAVPVNKDVSADNLQHIFCETRPKAVITNKLMLSRLKHGMDPDGCDFIDISDYSDDVKAFEVSISDHNDTDMTEVSDNNPAMLIYTSGTTKLPKGVVLTHGNLCANTDSILQYLKLTPEDSILATISFTYSYGNSVLLTHIKAGGTIIIENRSTYPIIILEQLSNTQVTGYSTLGSYLNRLLKIDNISSGCFRHLRYVTLAGERTNHEDIVRLNALAPHIRIFNMYGQTEASARLSCLEPEMLFAKAGSVGRGIPGVKLRVVREDGRDVKVGETGEVIAYGANIMKGYWNNEAETREVIRNGWLYTGDLAEIDCEGYIYLKGRKDDIIKHLGYRISPSEIEAVINACDEVVESAVVEVYAGRVTRIKAYIVAKDAEPDHEKISRFIRQRLPAYKRPHVMEFIKELPRTANGKIMRSALRKIQENTG